MTIVSPPARQKQRTNTLSAETTWLNRPGGASRACTASHPPTPRPHPTRMMDVALSVLHETSKPIQKTRMRVRHVFAPQLVATATAAALPLLADHPRGRLCCAAQAAAGLCIGVLVGGRVDGWAMCIEGVVVGTMVENGN